MSIVVLKFGGTSLANTKLMNDAASKVVAEVKKGHKVVVVVSAMAGITDHLINMTHEFIQGDNANNLAEFASIISTGEQVAAGLFSLILLQKELNSRSWLGWQLGINTDNSFEDSNILNFKTDVIINEFNNGLQVAVVAGFQGVNEGNRITTLGRGGSDTTAIILAGYLHAKRCHIYTDVDGVFTADPRIVSKAHKLASIHYDEMIELSYAGAKVLQAKSVEWAKHFNIKLKVLSSFTNNSGTTVSNEVTNRQIVGIALSKDTSNINIAKISIIGTNIASTLINSLRQILATNSIEILSDHFTQKTMSFFVKEDDKFEAIRLLHTGCNLD